MTKHLLDSDAVIDFLYDIAGSIELINLLFEVGDTPCTCDIVVAEVFTGLAPGEEGRAVQLFGALEYLPTTMAAARQAGEWRHQYRRRGRAYATTDCLIAAVAVTHQAALVTGNLRDFPMPELTIVPLPRTLQSGRS